MRNKTNHLYLVMLITGVAVTIFSLIGIAAITGYFPVARWDTPATQTQEIPETVSQPPQRSPKRSTLRTVMTAQKTCSFHIAALATDHRFN